MVALMNESVDLRDYLYLSITLLISLNAFGGLFSPRTTLTPRGCFCFFRANSGSLLPEYRMPVSLYSIIILIRIG
jgi:hypothetical protein